MSMLLAMQYRSDFLLDGVIEIFSAATALIPLLVVFRARPLLAGWTFGESLLVTGWFFLLQGVIEGAINPSLSSVIEHIRKGTLDFVLLKPADAQFLLSTARFQPWRATNVLTALVIFGAGFSRLGRLPSVSGVMLLVSVMLLYSLWILTVSAAFHVVRVDNLTYLFASIFDAARWPSSVFRGALRLLFTFVIPLAVMTTFPAQALLGSLPGSHVLLAAAGAGALFSLSRWVWLRSLADYTSASS